MSIVNNLAPFSFDFQTKYFSGPIASLSCRFRTNSALSISQRKKVLDKIVFTFMATLFNSENFHVTDLSFERKVQQLLSRDMANFCFENRRKSSKIINKF
jgi:hypothetical protein